METLLKKLKSFAAGLLAIAILTGSTVTSCSSPQKQADETEQTEDTQESGGSEHPTDGGSEHPSDNNEMESDSTATSDEHPSGDEGSEHPSN
jgi:hypothetical protein